MFTIFLEIRSAVIEFLIIVLVESLCGGSFLLIGPVCTNYLPKVDLAVAGRESKVPINKVRCVGMFFVSKNSSLTRDGVSVATSREKQRSSAITSKHTALPGSEDYSEPTNESFT
jgi:hypothetical protein